MVVAAAAAANSSEDQRARDGRGEEDYHNEMELDGPTPPTEELVGRTLQDSSDVDEEAIQPVALLMDELKSEETTVRVAAMRQLPTICLALGPERTRSELLPFLQCSYLEDEEDEVLHVLAEQTAGLVEFVGGGAYVQHLVPLLEGLVAAEEPCVRGRAMEAFGTVIECLPTAIILMEAVVPTVQRLAAGEWFSKKSSAAGLIVQVVRRLRAVGCDAGSLNDLLKLYESLLYDDTPLVRKAVATNLSPLAMALYEFSGGNNSPGNYEELAMTLILLCTQLAADPQDSVRLLSVEPLATLLSLTSKRKKKGMESGRMEKLVPLFLTLASDTSWRIRLMVATHYGRLTETLKEIPQVDVLGIFCALLRDGEAEVRAAAASQVDQVAELLVGQGNEAVEEQLVPTVRLLLSDPSPHVRASLALHLSDLGRVLGATRASTLILPMILQFLRDDSSEVRLNVISKLDVIVGVMGIEQLSTSLLPAIVTLAEDRQWRVRQTIIEYIPDLVAHLGREFLTEKILPLLIGWLDDPVYTVRQTTIAALRRIMIQSGPLWSEEQLLPRLLSLAQHRNYLRRVTFLMTLAVAGDLIQREAWRSFCLPLFRQLAADPIANVRFNVAKAFRTLIPVWLSIEGKGGQQSDNQRVEATDRLQDDGHDGGEAELLPVVFSIIKDLQGDADADVRYYAAEAAKVIPASFISNTTTIAAAVTQ